MPWLASQLGWIVAEHGRQPWAIEGILPTALGVSSVSTAQVMTSLIGFVLFYTVLAVVDVFLMLRYVRKGPDGLGNPVRQCSGLHAGQRGIYPYRPQPGRFIGVVSQGNNGHPNS